MIDQVRPDYCSNKKNFDDDDYMCRYFERMFPSE